MPQDVTLKLQKILIANRGEIACRIARTASDLGIETVAVYSPDDASCLHVKYADEAVALPGAGVNAYLDIDALIKTARQTGCDGVHPGYGLLSERADFVAACADNGVCFIGPDASVMTQLGDKAAARTLARKAGAPVIEGADLLASVQEAQAFFDQLGGRPMMLKAVNGGGGRGMRIVHEAAELESAFAQCQAEAKAAFGADALYAELFLSDVRHLEVQIVGDGVDVAHLWERDCSIQRRHQKLIELAPAPRLDPVLRDNLLGAAVRIGRACGYKGVGTIEFLVPTSPRNAEDFYFVEANPRIQVEHTITEEITGVDLVEAQLRIASGARLDEIGIVQASATPPKGCAVQLRINTERLSAGGEVTPTGGALSAFHAPGGLGVRVDSHGYRGYSTNPNFDSLLAKLVVHSKSDEVASVLKKARRALAEFQIDGVETNSELISELLALEDVIDWSFSVRSIGERINAAVQKEASAPARYFADTDAAQAQTPSAISAESFPEGLEPVRSPMQACVTSYSVAAGDLVSKGAELAVIEAMKMQHVITAPAAGRVSELLAEIGEVVHIDQALALIEPTGEEGAEAGEAREIDLDYVRPDLKAFIDRIDLTLDEARPDAVARRRGRGQRTARENVADLCDEGSFNEYGQLGFAAQRRRRSEEELQRISPADGIITGVGSVNGAMFSEEASRTAVLAYDGSVFAGTQGGIGHKKTDRLLHLAEREALPLVFFTEGGGGRPNDTDYMDLLASTLEVDTFRLMAKISGRAPKIGVNSGFCFAGNAAVFGACDIKIAARSSFIGLSGPAMIEAGGLGACRPDEIGPGPMQAQIGLVDLLAEDEAEATAFAKKALSYFQGDAPTIEPQDQRRLRHLIPENRKRVYDIRMLIETLCDEDSFLELGRDYAPGMVTGLLRIDGRALGVFANNPAHLGGAIDAAASRKAARFLRLCERYKMPVLSLCDTPGFMVGPESETQGAVEFACEFLAAGATLTMPLVFVALRKAYGIGAQAMAGGSFVAPFTNVSWPTGEFGPMGLEGAVQLGFKRELEALPDDAARQALFDNLVQAAYAKGGALNVASLIEIDAVIDPSDTRGWITHTLRSAMPR